MTNQKDIDSKLATVQNSEYTGVFQGYTGKFEQGTETTQKKIDAELAKGEYTQNYLSSDAINSGRTTPRSDNPTNAVREAAELCSNKSVLRRASEVGIQSSKNSPTPTPPNSQGQTSERGI